MKNQNQDKIDLILKKMRQKDFKRGATANQIIDSIHSDMIASGGTKMLLQLGWRYFVHLNKLFSPMEKMELIRFTGERVLGDTGRLEKVWKTT